MEILILKLNFLISMPINADKNEISYEIFERNEMLIKGEKKDLIFN